MTSNEAAAVTDGAGSNRPAPVVLSVNVGLPKNVAWQGKTVYTGIWKQPVQGPVMARRLNLDGDGQGDLNGHGGEQRALLVYQIGSYRHWARHFGRDDFGYGQFGENLTVDGLGDASVTTAPAFTCASSARVTSRLMTRSSRPARGRTR
jgi:MOSC domain-containing protein YiiM